MRVFARNKLTVVPGKRANGSRECAPDDRLRERDPGPITTALSCYEGCGSSSLLQQGPVVMGPGLRRDDSWA